MASNIEIECPECSATLNLPDSSKLGKKIRCPKCKEVFVAEAPEGAEDSDDDVDDEPATPKKGKPAASGKKGKKSAPSKSGSNAGLLIGVAIVGLIVVGGGGAYFMLSGKSAPAPAPMPVAANNSPAAPAAPPTSAPAAESAAPPAAASPPPPAATPISPTEKMAGLRWMPSDTELVIHVKVAELIKSPLLAGFLNNPLMNQGAAPGDPMNFSTQAQFGVAPADIESVSFGYAKLTDEMVKMAVAMKAQQDPKPAGAAATPSPDAMGAALSLFAIQELHYVTIIKSKTAFDLKKLSETHVGSTQKELSGKAYYELPVAQTPNSKPYDMAWWSPEPNLLIMGSKPEVLATVEHGETVIPRKELSATNFQPLLVIAAVLPNLDSNPKFAPFEQDPSFAAARAVIKNLGLQGGSVGLNVTSGIDLQITAMSSTDEGAKALKGLIDGQVKAAKGFFAEYKKTAPPLLGELGDMVLNNLKLDDRNKTVVVSTNIPGTAQDKLQQLPAIVMMMAMTGNMAAAGGPPAAPTDLVEAKLPGESAPIAAAEAEGLPEGMTLSAKSAWGTVTPAGATIELIVDMSGGDFSHICGTGALVAKSMTLEGGGSLRKAKPAGTASESGYRLYIDSPESILEHPPKTVRVKLAADVPRATAKTVSAFEGSFKLLTSEAVKEFTIDEAPRRAKRPLADEAFKEAGVKLRVSLSSVQPAWMTISSEKGYLIGQVKGMPGSIMSISDPDAELPTQRLIATEKDGKFPEDFQIAFQLHSKVKEQEVKFRFENLPVPSIDTKPSATVETKAPAAPAMTQQPAPTAPPNPPPAMTKTEQKPKGFKTQAEIDDENNP